MPYIYIYIKRDIKKVFWLTCASGIGFVNFNYIKKGKNCAFYLYRITCSICKINNSFSTKMKLLSSVVFFKGKKVLSI